MRTFLTLSHPASPRALRLGPLLLLAALSSACTRAPVPTHAAADTDAQAEAGVAPAPPPADASTSASAPWRFVVVGDTHVTEDGAPIASEMVPFIVAEAPMAVLVPGDIVQAGKRCTRAEMEAQLRAFKDVMRPLRDAGIPVYPVRGNHEADAVDSAAAWAASFRGDDALPANGPEGEIGLTYSFTLANALFIGLDEYVSLHRVNQPWLDAQLGARTSPHVFVFGHEPAFKSFHTDCLGSAPTERDAFWSSLSRAGARVYLTAHDHFLDVARIDDGDGHEENDVFQYVVGTGGGAFPPAAGAYSGDNGPFTPVGVSHAVQNGYLVVEVSGAGAEDRAVKMAFKGRECGDAGCKYEAMGALEVLARQ